jgi:hypothetical protein
VRAPKLSCVRLFFYHRIIALSITRRGETSSGAPALELFILYQNEKEREKRNNCIIPGQRRPHAAAGAAVEHGRRSIALLLNHHIDDLVVLEPEAERGLRLIEPVAVKQEPNCVSRNSMPCAEAVHCTRRSRMVLSYRNSYSAPRVPPKSCKFGGIGFINTNLLFVSLETTSPMSPLCATPLSSEGG